MARIKTFDPETATGLRRLLLRVAGRSYGYVPGIFKILAADLRLAFHGGQIYQHLHLRRSSPLTRLQREMVAVVVNGKVGGAP